MEQFGKYSLIRKIGTGGMAEVFLARTTVAQGLNKTLVIKKIHSAYARSRQFVSMFVDEAKIALGLNHPNIIQVFDFGAVADTYFLAMEYVDGVDLLCLLQEAAKAHQRLTPGLCAFIVQQLARGLDYAHRKADDYGQPLGIVHRDVSPQNILLSWDGSVKIVDFGIARARDVHEEEGVIKGKYAYMSPEQARGEPVDCRSDVFAAGIVLFELACARPLFFGKGKEVLEMARSGAIPRPRECSPELPESLERIMLRALAFHPEDRFPTARELQYELGRFLLEWGHQAGVLIDSGSLASALSQLIPQELATAPYPRVEMDELDELASLPDDLHGDSDGVGGAGGAGELIDDLDARALELVRAGGSQAANPREASRPAAAELAGRRRGGAGVAISAGPWSVSRDLLDTPVGEMQARTPEAEAKAALEGERRIPESPPGAVVSSELPAAALSAASSTASVTASSPSTAAAAATPAPAAAITSAGAALSPRGIAALFSPDAARSGSGPVAQAPVAEGTPRPRSLDRKYVYVLEGVLRGMASLERKLGPRGAARLVQQFYKIARDIAFKHDAVVDSPRLPVDGSEPPITSVGHEANLRVVVGLPIASEDDAGRALRLALALVDALDGIGSDVEPELRLALAVQRGVALLKRAAPAPGAPHELAFEIEESTASFAAKLARQARGAEILVGGRVFRAARAEWTFEPLPGIDLPDESWSSISGRIPVDDDTAPGVKRARVYRLRGPKDRSQRLRERRDPGRLYGRSLELKALRDAWRDVLVAKRQRQIIVIGDAGVGKRTLVRTFLDGIAPAEAIVIRTCARVGTAMTPFGVLADLARDVLGLAEDAEPREVERRLLRVLPRIFPDLRGGDARPDGEQARDAQSALETLGRLLGARGAAPVAEVDAEVRRQALIRLLHRIERLLEPDKPIVLFCEDLHWADQDSQKLFAALLGLGIARPIFGVMTSRPDARIQQLAKELGTEVLVLDEMPDAARREMLAERLVPGADTAELIDQIAARCGGNAFFIQELLDTLVERGVLVPDRPDQEHPGLLRWVLRDAPIHVPSTVEDLLVSRIDGLPAGEREALVHAAVLGRQVSAAALTNLIGHPVRTELDELARRGLLTPHAGTDEFRFKNDMTMTVAYGLIPLEARIQMHRAAAARIAGAPGYRVGQDDALIARHLELSGDRPAAAERYLRAAGHAVELGGNAEAFRQLSRALHLLASDDHDRRFTAHRLREEILRRLGRRPQQLRELHSLRKEAEALADAGKLAMTNCAIGQFYIDVGKAPAALRAVTPALHYARTAGDALLEAEALRLRAAITRLVGSTDESLRLIEQALALCGSPPDGDAATDARPATPVLTARATILNQRGTTLWNMGRLEAAIESFAEALLIYRALGMGRPEARALHHMGIVFAALGEYEAALAHEKSALKIDQALGDRSGIAGKLAALGHCYADLGDLERAEAHLGKSLHLAEQTGDLAAFASAAISLGQVKLARNDGPAVLPLLERGLALATENRDRYQEVRATQYIALAHLTLGNPPETALELARSSTDWARKMPMRVGILHGLAFQGVALSRLGRLDDALACVDEVFTQLPTARTEGAENLYRWCAEVLAAAGMHDAARAALERSGAEIDRKAANLRDPAQRELFIASRKRR